MTSHPLDRLHDLALFVGAQGELRAHLEDLLSRVASATDAAACSIMLLSEDAGDAPRLKLWCATDGLPAAAWGETPGRGEAIAGRVLESGASLLIDDIDASEFAPLARRRDALGASFICAPITLAKAAIGVLNLSSSPGAPPFDATSLLYAEIVAALIAKSVQVERLQTLVRSRLAHATLAREEKAVVTRLTDGSVPPARLAKMLAKSFFRDLSAAGFEADQIIEAASEIIALVSEDIRRYRRHTARHAK